MVHLAFQGCSSALWVSFSSMHSSQDETLLGKVGEAFCSGAVCSRCYSAIDKGFSCPVVLKPLTVVWGPSHWLALRIELSVQSRCWQGPLLFMLHFICVGGKGKKKREKPAKTKAEFLLQLFETMNEPWCDVVGVCFIFALISSSSFYYFSVVEVGRTILKTWCLALNTDFPPLARVVGQNHKNRGIWDKKMCLYIYICK